jgi:hypothetical protein
MLKAHDCQGASSRIRTFEGSMDNEISPPKSLRVRILSLGGYSLWIGSPSTTEAHDFDPKGFDLFGVMSL